MFSPQIIRFNTQIYSESLAYTYERGGKREKRLAVAKDNTDVSAKTVTDNERQLRFQVVQAFINVLLAKSVLQFAKEDLANFSQEVELNHARLVAGDLAEGDYLKISLQKLQFEQDVSAARAGPGAGEGDAAAVARVSIGGRRLRRHGNAGSQEAGGAAGGSGEDRRWRARPDLQAAHSGVKLASDTVSLAFGNRAKDWTWASDYTYQSIGPNGTGNAVGFSLSFDLPIHDRNQGEIARSQAAVRQADRNRIVDRGGRADRRGQRLLRPADQ